MEKYMFVFMGDDGSSMSPAEQEASMQKWFAWVDKLTKAERYIAGEALLPGSGKTIAGAKKTVTDGPFAEGKEIVGGFFLVYAKDLAEATEMAKDFPDFETGGIVEIREVMKFDM